MSAQKQPDENADKQSERLLSIFDRINRKLSDNLYRHGHYLTDPHANDLEKITEMVDDLMEFVREDTRTEVRTRVIDLIRRHKHHDVELDVDSEPQQ